jgi:two-component system, cell cycle response regulator DivK
VTAPPTILIIEDNPRNLKLVRDILDHLGYRTLATDNAEDGLAVAHRERPAMILMDVQLPGMDGVEALGRLRGDPAIAGIRVVALTAFAMKADRERFLSAGFDGYLEKPLNVPEFPGQIAALLTAAGAESRT